MSIGIHLKGSLTPEIQQILTAEALDFLAKLARRFEKTREDALERRRLIQTEIDRGMEPDFSPQTREIRDSEWVISPIPKDLEDRRVEITGPVDRKMVINALNSGAKVYMADFEDSHSPFWISTLQGQINLKDAVHGTLDYKSPEGKIYRLNKDVATLMVRPRGWHLVDQNLWIDGKPISASLFDFGLYFFHNAKKLIEKGTGPYFYLPKIEGFLEARLWNDVFVFAQSELGIPKGTIKATVLIETIFAAFAMNEILYELKEHSAGLNCGRWDYIFSFIKKFRKRSDFVFPDRARVTMQAHFLKSYSELLIQTCHRRNAHAMGGMAAQIPIKNDPQAHREAIEKVVADKEREVMAGHDGTWVAHPGLVPIALEVFDSHMQTKNQIHRGRKEVKIEAKDLLEVPQGMITEEGLRTNIRVGVQYLAAWLNGNGCVPLYNLMEDAATAEISRAQIWQWIHHPKGKLSDGRQITVDLFRDFLKEELEILNRNTPEPNFYNLAVEIFDSLATEEEFVEFLTVYAYENLVERGGHA